MLNLTDIERRILINQSRILAALYPLESSEFEHAANLLEKGYHEAWQEVVLKGLKAPFLKEEMNFVYQILEMYDWLQKSYYALSLEEKLQLKEAALVFPGFETEMEKHHLAYARFLIENLDRFAFVEVTHPLGTPEPMCDTYRWMLDQLPADADRMLTSHQITALVSSLKADAAMPVQHCNAAA